MERATSSVEFSFDNKLFFRVQKRPIYFRYVDDTVAVFKQESDADDFLVTLNCLHPALRFTIEKNRTVNFHF